MMKIVGDFLCPKKIKAYDAWKNSFIDGNLIKLTSTKRQVKIEKDKQ